MMGPKHHHQHQKTAPPPLTDELNGDQKHSALLDAFNAGPIAEAAALTDQHHQRPAKAKTEFGLRQFGDVIGRARSTLNVIDVWKSKLVSASSAAVARQLASSGGGETRGLGSAFGSKNKNKSVAGAPVRSTTTTSPPGAASAKSEISTGFSSVAAASRIKRRLFRRNKSLDFEAVTAIPSILVDENAALERRNSALIGRSVDNILGALVDEGDQQKQLQEPGRPNKIAHNRGRRRSSASILLPHSERTKALQDTQRRSRRRCYSHQEDDDDCDTNKVNDHPEWNKTSSVSLGDKFGRENVLNNKSSGREVREESKRSFGAKTTGHHYSHCCPVLLLDRDFDLDDFYYFYWKRKLQGCGGEPSEKTKQKRHERKEGKIIRAKLKLQKVTREKEGENNRHHLLHKRRLSDPTLSTATVAATNCANNKGVEESGGTTIVEELSDSSSARTTLRSSSISTVDMLTEEGESSSTTPTLSALGLPKKPRKKLSFKEPADSVVNSLSYSHRTRCGSLDSDLEVLAWGIVEWVRERGLYYVYKTCFNC